jgi:hypothetical protein
VPGAPLPLVVDLAQDEAGRWAGPIIVPTLGVKGAPRRMAPGRERRAMHDDENRPAQVEAPQRSTPVAADLAHAWREFELAGYPRHVTLTLANGNGYGAGATATLVVVG